MDAAKSHALLNETRSEHFKSLPFADGEVQSTAQTKYLRINITAQGIIPELWGHVRERASYVAEMGSQDKEH